MKNIKLFIMPLVVTSLTVANATTARIDGPEYVRTGAYDIEYEVILSRTKEDKKKGQNTITYRWVLSGEAMAGTPLTVSGGAKYTPTFSSPDPYSFSNESAKWPKGLIICQVEIKYHRGGISPENLSPKKDVTLTP